MIPSLHLDVAPAPGGRVYVSNPGMHRIEIHTPDGAFQSAWGTASSTLDAFCGCCNPMSLAALSNGDIVQFVGLCDINGKRVKAAQQMIGTNAPTYTDFDQMVKETKPDAVMVTTTCATHYRYVVRSMELGVDAANDRARLHAEEGVSIDTIQQIEGSKQPVDIVKIAALHSGVVTQINVREGSFVSASMPLFTLTALVLGFTLVVGITDGLDENSALLPEDVSGIPGLQAQVRSGNAVIAIFRTVGADQSILDFYRLLGEGLAANKYNGDVIYSAP